MKRNFELRFPPTRNHRIFEQDVIVFCSKIFWILAQPCCVDLKKLYSNEYIVLSDKYCRLTNGILYIRCTIVQNLVLVTTRAHIQKNHVDKGKSCIFFLYKYKGWEPYLIFMRVKYTFLIFHGEFWCIIFLYKKY